MCNAVRQVWSNTLAAEAAQHIRQCIYAHSNNRKNGENIYATTRSSLSYETAVRSWYNENKDYNYYCNSCNTSKVCGHYTQVSYHPIILLANVCTAGRLCGGRQHMLVVQWHFVRPFVTSIDGETYS